MSSLQLLGSLPSRIKMTDETLYSSLQAWNIQFFKPGIFNSLLR